MMNTIHPDQNEPPPRHHLVIVTMIDHIKVVSSSRQPFSLFPHVKYPLPFFLHFQTPFKYSHSQHYLWFITRLLLVPVSCPSAIALLLTQQIACTRQETHSLPVFNMTMMWALLIGAREATGQSSCSHRHHRQVFSIIPYPQI